MGQMKGIWGKWKGFFGKMIDLFLVVYSQFFISGISSGVGLVPGQSRWDGSRISPRIPSPRSDPSRLGWIRIHPGRARDDPGMDLDPWNNLRADLDPWNNPGMDLDLWEGLGMIPGWILIHGMILG